MDVPLEAKESKDELKLTDQLVVTVITAVVSMMAGRIVEQGCVKAIKHIRNKPVKLHSVK